MTRCIICLTGCIPMADYEHPVCIRCDARNDAAWVALLANPPRRGRHSRSQKWTLPDWAARLPTSHHTGPGDPADIAALLAEMDRGPRHATA